MFNFCSSFCVLDIEINCLLFSWQGNFLKKKSFSRLFSCCQFKLLSKNFLFSCITYLSSSLMCLLPLMDSLPLLLLAQSIARVKTTVWLATVLLYYTNKVLCYGRSIIFLLWKQRLNIFILSFLNMCQIIVSLDCIVLECVI